jgi:hypothetical protein
LDREMKALQTEHKLVCDELSSRQKEKEACIKKFKKMEIAQQAAKDRCFAPLLRFPLYMLHFASRVSQYTRDRVPEGRSRPRSHAEQTGQKEAADGPGRA